MAKSKVTPAPPGPQESVARTIPLSNSPSLRDTVNYLRNASVADLAQLIAVLEVEVRRRKIGPTVTPEQSNEAWLRGQLQTLEQGPAQAPPAPLARLALHFHNDDGPGIVVFAAGGVEHWRAQFGSAGKGGHATITDIHGRVVHVNLEYVTYVEIEPTEAAREASGGGA